MRQKQSVYRRISNMNPEDKFKKFLKSGTFSRWTHKYQARAVDDAREASGSVPPAQPEAEGAQQAPASGIEFEAALEPYQHEIEVGPDAEFELGYWSPEENSSDDEDEYVYEDDVGIDEEHPEPESLTTFMRNWSLEFNISHQALQPLLHRLHQMDNTLPENPRRLLQTPRKKAEIVEIDGGKYWHQGFGNTFAHVIK